jgi:hypothetical protein
MAWRTLFRRVCNQTDLNNALSHVPPSCHVSEGGNGNTQHRGACSHGYTSVKYTMCGGINLNRLKPRVNTVKQTCLRTEVAVVSIWLWDILYNREQATYRFKRLVTQSVHTRWQRSEHLERCYNDVPAHSPRAAEINAFPPRLLWPCQSLVSSYIIFRC